MINCTKKSLFLVLLLIYCMAGAFNLSAKPKEKEESTGVYKKYIHPREYVFDLADSKNKVSLKVDESTGKAYCNVDFTDLVREQMPRKGDKITFTYEGTPSKDLQSITATVYDLTKGENLGNKIPEIFANEVGKKQTFKKSFSLILNGDAEKSFTLRLTGNLPKNAKKTDKIDLNFKRVTESTNTKKEAEEEKQAIKKGLKVVRVKSNFTVVEKTEEPKAPEPVKNEAPVEVEPADQVEETAEIEEIAEDSTPAAVEEKIVIEEEIITEEEIEVEELEEIAEAEATNEEPVVEPAIEPIVEPVVEPEKPQEKVVYKVEPVIVPETPKVVVEDKKKNESTYEPIIVKNKVSRYEKEYLQDFAVTEQLEVEEQEADEEETKIQNPDEKDTKGRTKLMIAAKNGDKAQIKLLLSSDADINLSDNQGWTALMYAARYQKDLTSFDLLLEADADVKIKNKYGLSALVIAASYNENSQIISRLLRYYSPSDKEVLKAFITLLSESKNTESVQIAKIKAFIDFSIPVNSFYSGKTPLMYAAQYNNSTKVIRVLLENNALTNIRSNEGKTAFDYAKANINLEHDNVYWTLNKK